MWTTRSWLRMLTAAALCVTAVHCGSSDGSSIPRGANPSAAARYASLQHGSPSGIFVCDGDRSIDRDRVNDDYCDCDDGTDEPGACIPHSPPHTSLNVNKRTARLTHVD
jgi:protein kinase C substrate 80K-H